MDPSAQIQIPYSIVAEVERRNEGMNPTVQ